MSQVMVGAARRAARPFPAVPVRSQQLALVVDPLLHEVGVTFALTWHFHLRKSWGGGLEFVEKSDRRHFFEQDVIEYLWDRSLLSVLQVLSYAVFMQYGILFKIL
jgi:hypothetical protein